MNWAGKVGRYLLRGLRGRNKYLQREVRGPQPEDDVRHAVVAEVPGHDVRRPVEVVPDGGVGPGLEQQVGRLQPAQHGRHEQRAPPIAVSLLVEVCS